jgi:hypothetical protein
VSFVDLQQWLELERKAKMGPVSGFGKQAGDLLKSVLAGYDAEAAFFDESVRVEKRKGLFTSALGVSPCKWLFFCNPISKINACEARACFAIGSMENISGLWLANGKQDSETSESRYIMVT